MFCQEGKGVKYLGPVQLIEYTVRGIKMLPQIDGKSTFI